MGIFIILPTALIIVPAAVFSSLSLGVSGGRLSFTLSLVS